MKALYTAVALAATALCTASTARAAAPKLNDHTFLLTERSADAPYRYNDALKALAAVNEAARKHKTVTLYVEPGVYWLDDPDDPGVRVNPRGNGEVPYAVELECDSLAIIGLAKDPRDVVWAVNRGQTQGALGNYTMIHYKGRAMQVENLTFGNYCNADLEYPRDPSRNRPKRREAIVQAQLGWLDGTDKLLARNCRFISRLNLCPLMGARRSLYKDCYFECTDDALTGTAVYQGCGFTFYSGKPLYSAPETGAVFLDCDIHTLVDGTQYFTKAPGPIAAVDVRFTSDGPVELQWTRDESPVVSYQSGITLNGQPVVVDSGRPSLSQDIKDTYLEEAFKVTLPNGKVIYNTPNLLAGDDGWDPLGVLPEIKKAEKKLGRSLTQLPVALRLTPSAKNLEARGDLFTLTPQLLRWGGYDLPGTPKCAWMHPQTVEIDILAPVPECKTANDLPVQTVATLHAITEYGLWGGCNVTMAPWLKEAPEFASVPNIKGEEGCLTASYDLSGNGDDDSYIVWYRYPEGNPADTVAVRHGHGAEGRTYPLTAADRGHGVAVKVTPRYKDTQYGVPFGIVEASPQLIAAGTPAAAEEGLATSFAEVPLRATAHGLPGLWHFDTYKPADTSLHKWEADGSLGWYYGRGVDAVTGEGLVQSVRGARMSYTPVRDNTSAMKVALIAEPAKGPGQGFGSATGQYMDLCLMFNPVTLTGYALRIQRTPEYDKAVTFTLVKYDNGTVEPLGESVATSCFRNPCNIEVEYAGGRLTARAATDAKPVSSKDPRILPEVALEAEVKDVAGGFGGQSFMVQHTGTTGPGATLLRDLRLNWQ